LTRICRPFCISEPVGVRDRLDDQLQDHSRFVQILSSQALMSICWSASQGWSQEAGQRLFLLPGGLG
jgi:hypothetical protein